MCIRDSWGGVPKLHLSISIKVWGKEKVLTYLVHVDKKNLVQGLPNNFFISALCEFYVWYKSKMRGWGLNSLKLHVVSPLTITQCINVGILILIHRSAIASPTTKI